MAKSHNIIFEEDRISDLPRNVIDLIMDFMSVRDAARTCVLSSNWRYVWADHPSLVLDKDFWDDNVIHRNRLASHIDYADIVGSILLSHVGHIKKFAIDVSLADSLPDCKIDLWLSSLCRRRLKKLDLWNSESINLYKLPSFVLSTSELTYLAVSYCIIKSKDTGGCFTNIRKLIMEDVILDSVVLKAPLLTSLTLERCRGVADFDISAPKLASLTLDDNDCLNLKPFLTCKRIREAYLCSSEYIVYFEECRNINLLELLAAWPRISLLEMNGICFKYLATGSAPAGILKLKLREFILWEMLLDLNQIAWILCILKNSPRLQTFDILFSITEFEEVNGAGVDEPAHINMDFRVNVDESAHINMDFRIEQLRTIKMQYFTASKVEVMFAKILLRCAPQLKKMLVEEHTEIDPYHQIHILKNLLLLQQAFPSLKIIFGPNIVVLN